MTAPRSRCEHYLLVISSSFFLLLSFSSLFARVVQGMELPNFRRGCHLYSAGRPSRCALAHISSFIIIFIIIAGMCMHVHSCVLLGGAGGKGVWGKPGSELDETGVCSDSRDPNYDSDSQVLSTTFQQ